MTVKPRVHNSGLHAHEHTPWWRCWAGRGWCAHGSYTMGKWWYCKRQTLGPEGLGTRTTSNPFWEVQAAVSDNKTSIRSLTGLLQCYRLAFAEIEQLATSAPSYCESLLPNGRWGLDHLAPSPSHRTALHAVRSEPLPLALHCKWDHFRWVFVLQLSSIHSLFLLGDL